MSQTNSNPRFPMIDWIRGFAVFLMIIFHLSFDLSYFKFVEIDFYNNKFWYFFPRFIVFLFLLSMGISLQLTYHKQIYWKGLWKRFFKILTLALLISLFTYFAFPKSWIYFGTLHCIALSSVLAVPFINKRYFSLFFSVIIMLIFLFFDISFLNLKNIFHDSPLDYIPLYPWFSIVLLGIFLEGTKFYQKNYHFFPFKIFFEVLGKYSLKIYMVHQLFLFCIVWAIFKIIHS